jgi:hypothetical protein
MRDHALVRLSKIANHFFLGALYGILLSLAPVALINHRHLGRFLFEQSWPKICFFLVACLFSGILASIYFADIESEATAQSGLKNLARQFRWNSFETWGTLAAFWFVACAALCEKLSIAPLQEEGVRPNNWPALGFLMIASALSLQVASLLHERRRKDAAKPAPKEAGARVLTIAHPFPLGCLVVLLGVSLLFSTWFTLFAVPGLYVALKWHLKGLNDLPGGGSESSGQPGSEVA